MSLFAFGSVGRREPLDILKPDREAGGWVGDAEALERRVDEEQVTEIT